MSSKYKITKLENILNTAFLLGIHLERKGVINKEGLIDDGNVLFGKNTHFKSLEKEIKSLFLSIVGEDENPEEEYNDLHPDTRLNMPLEEYRQSIDERNEIRAELRNKIKEL